ncbi:exocyst complex component exo70, partial [Coemansia aciculifera]
SLAQFGDMSNGYIRSNSYDGQLPGQNRYSEAASRSNPSEVRFCTIRNEHWYEPGTSPYAQYTLNMVKLFQAERDLVRRIMPTVISEETFISTTDRPFETFIATGEKMVSFFLSSPLYEVLQALDVYGYMLENDSVLDSLLSLRQRHHNGLSKLLSRLQLHLSKSFTALINMIRGPFKDDTMPKQTGGVHELVYNTLTFLAYVIIYKDLLTNIFLPLGDGHWNQGTVHDAHNVSQHASDPSDGLSIFQHYLRDVVEALSFMIEQGGKQMKRPALQFVFLINNHSYLARALRDAMYAGDEHSQSLGLGDLVGRSALSRPESQIERSRKGYMATWKALMSSFPAATLSPAEKLSMFNQGFDEMVRAQKAYEIFDTDVRAMLISDACDAVLPDYEAFLRQNPDRSPEFTRAMKYTPRDIQRKLSAMLDD